MKKLVPNPMLAAAPHFPTSEVLASNAYMIMHPDWEEHRIERRLNWVKEYQYHYQLIARALAPVFFHKHYQNALAYVAKNGNPIQFTTMAGTERMWLLEDNAKNFGVITGFNVWKS